MWRPVMRVDLVLSGRRREPRVNESFQLSLTHSQQITHIQQFRANLAQKVQNVEKMPLKLTSKIKIDVKIAGKIDVKKNVKLKFDAFKSQLKCCFLHIL
jgi:hypothetical protein